MYSSSPLPNERGEYMTKLELKNISIEFPGVKALDGANFSCETGTVQALIGANGAGKSTLMKILSGAYNHYTGGIFLDGKEISISSPREAQQLGIQTVYQEVDTALIPYLTVGENIMLPYTIHESGKNPLVNWKELHERATQILSSLNLNLSSKKLVQNLTLAEKQMILIARALTTSCRFLILDEPTAPLSHQETTELFRVIKKLIKKDVGIIFISHRLPEIFEICDEVTVMRNGKTITTENIEKTNQHKIIEQMLGRSLDEQFPSIPVKFGEKVLEVLGLTDSNIYDISLDVKAGEIVGIAGLVGAGKTELCKALFGDSKIVAGQITINGKQAVVKNPYDAVKKGIALVPEERRKEGILVEESVLANLTAANLKPFTRLFGFLNRNAEKQKSKEIIESLGVKTPSEQTKVGNLSGGNQQKVVIGKWLVAEADLYIFDEPTKGVDVGAKRDLFELIVELAKKGKGILYASSELSEIMGITNRVYVMYDGKTVKELHTKNTSEEELLFYSTGGGR
jgi:simple sugar transport system ATP-binding protein